MYSSDDISDEDDDYRNHDDGYYKLDGTNRKHLF